MNESINSYDMSYYYLKLEQMNESIYSYDMSYNYLKLE